MVQAYITRRSSRRSSRISNPPVFRSETGDAGLSGGVHKELC